MTLQQLRYFLAMCEERNFTRAARRCGVSQPSLSNAIRALELDFGGPLFFRNPNGHLTKLGKTIQPLIQSAMQTLEAATQVAARRRAASARTTKLDRVKPPSVNNRRRAPLPAHSAGRE
jgi:DNA-binding transcriptional LysR family regulator